MNAAAIAQKITNGISCIVIVVFSVAPNTTTSHYKTFGVSSLSNIRRASLCVTKVTAQVRTAK